MNVLFRHIAIYLCSFSLALLLLHDIIPHDHHFEAINHLSHTLHHATHNCYKENLPSCEHTHHKHQHQHHLHHHHGNEEHQTEACNFSYQVQKQELSTLFIVIFCLLQFAPVQEKQHVYAVADARQHHNVFVQSTPWRGPPCA